MADTDTGLSPYPGMVSSLQSRCICAKCGVEPQIKSARNDDGVVTMTVACHGDTETRVLTKDKFTFTQKFFATLEAE